MSGVFDAYQRCIGEASFSGKDGQFCTLEAIADRACPVRNDATEAYHLHVNAHCAEAANEKCNLTFVAHGLLRTTTTSLVLG
jgi:hypothetical protein